MIHEFYGSTESGAVTFANSADALKKPGTVGKISPGAELRFVREDGKLLPQGEIGEIYSRISDNPDFTYQNKPEKRVEIERDGFIPRAMSVILTGTATSSSAIVSATW